MRKWTFVIFGAFAVSLGFGIYQYFRTGEYNLFDIVMVLAFGYFSVDEIRRIIKGRNNDEPQEWEEEDDDYDRLG